MIKILPSLFILGSPSVAMLAEPFSLAYRVTGEVAYDDNVVKAEGREAEAGDLVARVNPVATLWRTGVLLQYDMGLKKNASHRGEDTNRHLIVAQLRREVSRYSSLLLAARARLRYTESTPFDNNLYSLSADLARHLTPLTSLNARMVLGRQTYVEFGELSWNGGTVALGVRHHFSNGLELSGGGSAGLKRYRRDAIAFTAPCGWDTLGSKQEDCNYSVSSRVGRGWGGLLIEAEAQVARNISSSEPYEYWSALAAVCLVGRLTRQVVLEVYGSVLAKTYDVPWSEPPDERPELDPEEGKDQTALILRLVRDLSEDLSLSVCYRHLRREGRFPDRYYLKNDIGLGLSLKS